MNDELLLIRTSYRPWYSVPGGGVHRGEAPRLAAARELREEVGIAVEPDALRALGEFVVHHTWIEDHVHAFELRLEAHPPLRVDRREVVWAGFRPRGARSADAAPLARASGGAQATGTKRPRASSRSRSTSSRRVTESGTVLFSSPSSIAPSSGRFSWSER